MHFSHAVKPKSNSAFRKPLHYPVAIYLLELTKGSQVVKQQARKLNIISDNSARGCFKIPADRQRNQEQRLCSCRRPDRDRVSKELKDIPRQRLCLGPSQKPEGAKRKAPGTDLCTTVPLHRKHEPSLFDAFMAQPVSIMPTPKITIVFNSTCSILFFFFNP